jgi:hypothetical protein
MTLLANPVRLMLGYLLGAPTSVTLGLVIIFPGARRSCSGPAVIKVLPDTGEHDGERSRTGPPRWQRALGKGSARTRFAVGAMLTTFLAGLSRIHKPDYSAAEPVVAVVAFNAIMLALLEILVIKGLIELRS